MPFLTVQGMIQPLFEERVDMLIVQGIVHLPPFLTVFHQMQGPQGPQLVRDGRLAHTQCGSDVTNAQLAMGQGRDDAHSRGVAERFEGFGYPGGSQPIHKMGGRFPHPILINVSYLTASFSTHRFAPSSLWSQACPDPSTLLRINLVEGLII